MIMIDDL